MASIDLHSKNGSGDGSRSPPARAPWSKIVSGESSELSPPAVSLITPAVSPSPSPSSILDQIMNASTDWYSPETEGSDGGGGGGGGGDAVKKAVWSKPSNGVVEVVCCSVMGAVSWPALGESTKAAVRSSSFESVHSLSDGSLLLPSLQVTGNSASPTHKQASVNPASTPIHVTHTEQRPMKRGGGSLGSGAYSSSNGGVSKPDIVAMDSVPKESPRGGFGSQTNSQQSSYRRGNGGPYSRGEGSYHHNYGGKLDQGQGQGQGQGRGNQEWNQHRNNNRGGYRRGGYIRPALHNSTPFMHPPMRLPVRPFGNNVMYPVADVASSMAYFQGPAPPMVPGPRYFPFPDPLHGTIMKQIEYYFSNENLVKDTYLRRNMDEHGWVPVNLIAGFKKVSCLTDNVQLILDVMRQSTVVEVQGDKMRQRNDWMRWLMPPAVQDPLASQLQGIGLDSRSSSGGGEPAAVA